MDAVPVPSLNAKLPTVIVLLVPTSADVTVPEPDKDKVSLLINPLNVWSAAAAVVVAS